MTSVWGHEFRCCLGIPGHFWKSKDQSLTRATSRGASHPVLMESGKDVTTNEIILWPPTYRKSSQLLEVFTRIEIYLVYILYVYIYILLICIPSYNHFLSTLQHHSKFPITDSWNTWQPWHPPESKRSESLNTWQGVISSHQPWRSLENHPNRESLVNWDWNPL